MNYFSTTALRYCESTLFLFHHFSYLYLPYLPKNLMLVSLSFSLFRINFVHLFARHNNWQIEGWSGVSKRCFNACWLPPGFFRRHPRCASEMTKTSSKKELSIISTKGKKQTTFCWQTAPVALTCLPVRTASVYLPVRNVTARISAGTAPTSCVVS